MQFLRLIPCAVLLSTAAMAQSSGGVAATSDNEALNRALYRVKGRSADVVGTPFLLPFWTRGNVKTTSGAVPRPWLKYDLAGERLLWRRPTGDSLELDTNTITEFSLGDSLRGERHVFRRYLTSKIADPLLRTAFFEVGYDGGRSALLKRRSRLLYHDITRPSLTAKNTSKWQETTLYYLKRGDNVIEPIRLNPKAVLAALGKDKAPVLQAYAAREGLDLSTETDVVKLLQYYDTL